MLPFLRVFHPRKHEPRSSRPNRRLKLLITVLPLLFPIAAYASPFDSGITSIQTLFRSTIARAASLIAIVIGGYSFAHGDPGAKKTLGGVAAGTGIAVLAVNVLSWLWGA
jgi:type IV secretory pathway VirB2 component (pilin)